MTPTLIKLITEQDSNHLAIAPITKFDFDYKVIEESDTTQVLIFMTHRYLDFTLYRDSIFTNDYWVSKCAEFEEKEDDFESKVVDELELILMYEIHQAAADKGFTFEDGRSFVFDWTPSVFSWIETTKE